MAKITLTRALVELKTLDERIQKATNQQFVGLVKGTDKKPTLGMFKDAEQMERAFTANFNQVNDLMTRRQKIKSALVVANASTIVSINGNIMSIADAIDSKRLAEFRAQLIRSIRQQISNASNAIEKNRVDMEANIQAQIDRILGNDQKGKDAVSQNKDMIETIRTTMFNLHDMKIVDPNKLVDDIERLSNELEAFISEIDFSLSEVNAKTEIEID